MSDDTMTGIFQRHAAALFAVAQSDRVHIDAVRLALALAMREVADDAANNGVIEALTAKLDEAAAHINTLIAARDALRQQIAQLDAENDELKRECTKLRMWIDDANNAAPIRGNGKSAPAAVLVQAFEAGKPSTDYAALDWSSLSHAAQDYRIGLDAGRWKWRDIPRAVRLELVRCVIRNAGDAPTQAQFDAVRPRWMATANAQVAAFAVQWGILANLNREIEVV